ncbi:aspartate/glutamate racemase family protein [Limimaricola pyoseonensis]|uniref:Aspartate racemase n=1 Tax=Limimaricola pyoseonensis TaxID=521013 RepID=A0A1G7HPF8_9RHOB|nr:amino acid racemase [Limimaricola pyoseonensis]SDF02184.1 aspartate racemase [Limimaricola pyoseonensis]
MSLRRIGILGGMGPEATVLLMQRLIAATPARDDADHVPLLVDMNPQVPSRIARLIEGRGADPGPVLAGMARGLEAAGATALAMPCNTAHHYAPEIRAAVSVPFIDMVALSVAHAARRAGPGGRVGLLGSPALRRIELYDRACAAAGLDLVHPGDEAGLLAAIRAIKAHGPDPISRAALRAASSDLLSRGATLQLVACTEFSLIADAVASEALAVDTLDLLVEGIRAAAAG